MLFFWHFYLTAAIIILNIFVGRISAIWPFSTGTKSTPKDIFSTNSVDSLINSNFINSNEPRRQSSLTRKTEDPFVGNNFPLPSNGLGLSGMNVFPSQQFTDLMNENRGIGMDDGIRRRDVDLETWTKNHALRTNRENAVISQLVQMAPMRRNQLARDIAGGNMSATNELVSHLLRELVLSPSGNVVFPEVITNNLQHQNGIFSSRNPFSNPSLFNRLGQRSNSVEPNNRLFEQLLQGEHQPQQGLIDQSGMNQFNQNFEANPSLNNVAFGNGEADLQRTFQQQLLQQQRLEGLGRMAGNGNLNNGRNLLPTLGDPARLNPQQRSPQDGQGFQNALFSPNMEQVPMSNNGIDPFFLRNQPRSQLVTAEASPTKKENFEQQFESVIARPPSRPSFESPLFQQTNLLNGFASPRTKNSLTRATNFDLKNLTLDEILLHENDFSKSNNKGFGTKNEISESTMEHADDGNEKHFNYLKNSLDKPIKN